MRLKTMLATVPGGLLFATAQVFAADVERQITKVAGDVQWFQNDRHFSLVTVSDAGVVVVDLINAAASWLKASLHTIIEKSITPRAGKDLAALKTSITMDAYRD